MCGIIAISGKDSQRISDVQANAMLSCLKLRGPDDQAFSRFSNAVIGQTRLAIVDISGGHQPMKDNTNPYTIVFNGEIYGYRDLRGELEKKGHKFSTHSDTEVILKSYAEYGKECVKYIDGMFTFAIWDEHKQEMFIARDRFGKKPFYYTNHEGLFLAASEIKSLFALNLFKGKIDPEALEQYLRLMYIPPQMTIYSNISTLPPAHAGIVKNGILESWRYWQLEKKEVHISYEDAKLKIKELFDEAVKKRMVADVEIGSLLSGGVDSTLVTQYAQKYSKTPVKTFSVGYEGGKSELPYALEASKKIGTDHYTLDVHTELSDELERIISYMDEPHGDSSNFPQHLISGVAASKVKVALTGDGADEIFMGYGWYQKFWHTPKWKISRLFGNPYSVAQKMITIFTPSERKMLLVNNTHSTESSFERDLLKDIKDPIDKINAFDLQIYLPGQLLTKIDRTSMMHSLEIRSPFLDTILVEYVYNLPLEYKISETKNKIILKDILTETFPPEFVYRRKQGFGAPVEKWLKEYKTQKIVDVILDEANRMFNYIDRTQVFAIYNNFYGKGTDAHKLWILVCLALWFRTHNNVIA